MRRNGLQRRIDLHGRGWIGSRSPLKHTTQLLQHITKSPLTVGRANRAIQPIQLRIKINQIAIVCKHPMPSPHFTHKRVAVLQIHLTLGRLANMRNHIQGFNRIRTHQMSHRGGGRWLAIHQQTTGAFFKKSDAPTIGVVIRRTTPLGKTFKRKHDVRGYIAIHSEQLAHDDTINPLKIKIKKKCGLQCIENKKPSHKNRRTVIVQCPIKSCQRGLR